MVAPHSEHSKASMDLSRKSWLSKDPLCPSKITIQFFLHTKQLIGKESSGKSESNSYGFLSMGSQVKKTLFSPQEKNLKKKEREMRGWNWIRPFCIFDNNIYKTPNWCPEKKRKLFGFDSFADAFLGRGHEKKSHLFPWLVAFGGKIWNVVVATLATLVFLATGQNILRR